MGPLWRKSLAVALAPFVLSVAHACGGTGGPAPPPEPPQPPSFFDVDAAKVAPILDVRESTPRRWAATLRVPGVGAYAVEEGGGRYYRLSVSGGGTMRTIRRPELPVLAYHLVLPRLASGAPVPTPVIHVSAVETASADGIDVHPAQRSPFAGYAADVGQDSPVPFARDDAAYAKTEPFPSASFDARRVELDGFDVLELRVLPVRVWPGLHRIELAKRIDIDMELAPANEAVESAQAIDEVDETGIVVAPHEPLSPLLDNAEVVSIATRERVPFAPRTPTEPFDDPLYEYLVVTGPDFIAQANALARHKREARGMAVKVVRTDAIAGGGVLTPEALRDFVIAEYRHNRRLGSADDANEPDISDANDLRHATFYLHRAATGAALLGVDVALFGTAPQAALITYVDADRDGETDYEIASLPPYASFTVKKRTAPGAFTEIVHTGTPVARDRGVRYEVPWDVVRAGSTVPDRIDVHVVALQQPLDRLPDAGKITLDRSFPHPHALRYLLLLGDVEQIPLMTSRSSWEVMGGPAAGAGMLKIATDHYYASLDEDVFPEISVGRLPVDTAVEAQHAVDKIIRYETDDPFARINPRVATAAPFDDGAPPGGWDGQNDTFFLDAVERVRGYFVARGNRATAHYTANVTITPPARFQDGRPLPVDLAYPGYPWSTGPDELVGLFGAYDSHIVVHVDHGEVKGWWAPRFFAADVARVPPPALPMTGVHPIVFSLNCASGFIDTEADRLFYADGTSTDFDAYDWTHADVTSFAEALIRHEGGAVGVVAATRGSSVVYNNHLLYGLVLALYKGFPIYAADREARGASERALGRMLDDAKLYVDGVTLADADEWTDYTFKSYQELYHLFGDPSLRVQRLPRP